MEHSLAVANYFIRKANEEGTELTPMKLLKLVYIAHGWHLGIKGNELIDEGVEAWQYGPVVPSVYHEFKKYRDRQVTTPGYIFTEHAKFITPTVENQETVLFLKKVWDYYKGYNGLQLSSLTHQPDTPWDIVYNKKREIIIGTELIKEHYQSKAKKTTAFV